MEKKKVTKFLGLAQRRTEPRKARTHAGRAVVKAKALFNIKQKNKMWFYVQPLLKNKNIIHK